MSVIKRIWQKTAPNFLLGRIRFWFESKYSRDRRKSVLAYYGKHDLKTLEPEIIEGLKYLKHHRFNVFPYKWALKYENLVPGVFRDKETQFLYVLYEGKRMYFPKKFTEKQVIWGIRSIYKEQDPESPHLYQTNDFYVEPGSIVIDAGVAEGNFALSVVEKAKLIYLIECDTDWMDALKLTFAPWAEKVVFIKKFMSDSESESTTSIDSLIHPVPSEKYFIKMDIEGYEQKALMGMANLAQSENVSIKMDICTYHHLNDLEEIKAIVNNLGFKWKVSESFMLFFRSGEKPSFRRVLIRAEK